VILVNLGAEDFVVSDGQSDRLEVAEEFSLTERGAKEATNVAQ